MERKVLIITSEFPPLPGGIGNHAYHLSKQLAKNNFKVEVLTNSRDLLQEENFKEKCELQQIHVSYLKRFYGPLTYFSRLWKYRKSMKKLNENDLVIASGKFSILAMGLLRSKAKYLIVVHGTEIRQEGYNRKLFIRAFSNCNLIICVSKYTCEKLKKEFSDIKSRIEVINNGFELESKLVTNPISLKKHIKLITVGNMTPRKGQHNVIKALTECRRSGLHVSYNIVGIPTNKKELLDLATKLEVEEYVIFHDVLSNNDKIDILKESHIFIMLSEELQNGDFEGFGIAILEANAMGLPAVGSINSGIADAIDSGRSGILVNPHAPNEVCNAVKLICEDYSRFSENAKSHATKFTWDRIGARYLKSIESLYS